MRRITILLLLVTFGMFTAQATVAGDRIEPVTGLSEEVLKPIIERQARLDQDSGLQIRILLHELFAPATTYTSDASRARKQWAQDVFFANETIPTREEALLRDQELVTRGRAVPSRWFTFLWKDLQATEEQPSFAPELLAELCEKGWGDDGGAEFDLRVRRARNLLVFINEQEETMIPFAKESKFSLLGTGRHAVVMRFDAAPDYVCKVLRNKWAFPFQALSSVLWGHTLRRVIVERDLDRSIVIPDMYLVNLHGVRTFTADPESVNWKATQLRDHNYVVVERYIPGIPTKAENIMKWKAVTPELARDIAIAIRAAGIWDVRPTTIDLVTCKLPNGSTVEKAHFAHLECPGRGGYTASDFYQRTPEVTERLAEEGIKGLTKMLPSRVLEDMRIIEELGLDRVNDELVTRGERRIIPNELGA